jgi:hypothetical protein
MTSSTPAITSRADVTTDTPARYAKQLIAHLGRKFDFTTDGAISTATIGYAIGHIIIGDGLLTLLATGDDDSSVSASSMCSAATSSGSENATSSSPGPARAVRTPNRPDRTRRLARRLVR